MRTPRLFLGLSAAVLLLMGSAATFQGSPDFSGDWKADADATPTGATPGPAPATSLGTMGSGWGAVLTLRQDDKRLIVEYTLFSRYDLQPPLRLVYALDGSESVNTVMIGHTAQQRASRAVWKDQVLEIITQYPGIHPSSGKPFTTEVVQRLRLESADTLDVEVTRSTAGAQPSSTRTVYRRQPPRS